MWQNHLQRYGCDMMARSEKLFSCLSNCQHNSFPFQLLLNLFLKLDFKINGKPKIKQRLTTSMVRRKQRAESSLPWGWIAMSTQTQRKYIYFYIYKCIHMWGVCLRSTCLRCHKQISATESNHRQWQPTSSKTLWCPLSDAHVLL